MTAMLTESDIDFIYASRDEITAHRERQVTVIYVEERYDDITGEVIDRQTNERDVSTVVTKIMSAMSGDDRTMESGIVIEEGYIKVDIKIELVEDIAEFITKISYDGKDYEILSEGKKGIGRRNRIEYI